MALPVYATTGQRIGYYSFLTYCGLVFFFCLYLSVLHHFLNLQESLCRSSQKLGL